MHRDFMIFSYICVFYEVLVLNWCFLLFLYLNEFFIFFPIEFIDWHALKKTLK